MTEKAFATEFAIVATSMGCRYVDIPDMIPSKDRFENAKRAKEKKRPADAVLVTPYGCSLIELKTQYNTPLQHQAICSQYVLKVNQAAYFFVRRIVTKGRFVRYQLFKVPDIRKKWQLINESEDLKIIIGAIMGIQNNEPRWQE